MLDASRSRKLREPYLLRLGIDRRRRHEVRAVHAIECCRNGVGIVKVTDHNRG
jgi:hypothetical protein